MSLSSPFTYHPDGRDPGDSFVPFQCPVVSTSRHSENIKLRLFGAKRRTRTPLKNNIASLQLSSKVKPWSDGWQLQCRRSKQAHKILCVHKESGRSAMERKQTSYSPGGKVETRNPKCSYRLEWFWRFPWLLPTVPRPALMGHSTCQRAHIQWQTKLHPRGVMALAVTLGSFNDL